MMSILRDDGLPSQQAARRKVRVLKSCFWIPVVLSCWMTLYIIKWFHTSYFLASMNHWDSPQDMSRLNVSVAHLELPKNVSLRASTTRKGLLHTHDGSHNKKSTKSVCFVTAAYADEISRVDKINPATFANDPGFKHYLFTNLEDLHVHGWESIVLRFLSHYKHRITQSRYGKFMGWQVRQIKENCHTVFYMDGCIRAVHNASAFQDLASILHQPKGPGWVQARHGKRTGGVIDELKAIMTMRKDLPERVHKTFQWLSSQDDFKPTETHVYLNTYIGYAIPPSPAYERLSTDFWKVYSKEQITWRDQPLWSYFIQKHGVRPLAFPDKESRYFSKAHMSRGFGDHAYYFGNTSNAYSVAFLAENPSYGSFRMRGHQVAQQISANMITTHNSTESFLVSTHKCGELGRYNPDVCIFVGSCNLRGNQLQRCGLKILDVVDKYLYHKERIENSLSFFDGIIVNSESMKSYFRDTVDYTGDIQVLYHHSDPRWHETKKSAATPMTQDSSTPSLRFGFAGSIASLAHTDNLLYHQELRESYAIAFVDTDRSEIPRTVNFECDLSIRPMNSPVSKFKTTAKIATAAALGHNILTTADAAVMDVLPVDYPFLLKNSSREAVFAMMDSMIADYAGNQTLWRKGLQMMTRVNQTLNLPAVSNVYVSYLSRLVHDANDLKARPRAVAK